MEAAGASLIIITTGSTTVGITELIAHIRLIPLTDLPFMVAMVAVFTVGMALECLMHMAITTPGRLISSTHIGAAITTGTAITIPIQVVLL